MLVLAFFFFPTRESWVDFDASFAIDFVSSSSSIFTTTTIFSLWWSWWCTCDVCWVEVVARMASSWYELTTKSPFVCMLLLLLMILQ